MDYYDRYRLWAKDFVHKSSSNISIKDVITVVQVKKTLYGEEIDSSYQNLKSNFQF